MVEYCSEAIWYNQGFKNPKEDWLWLRSQSLRSVIMPANVGAEADVPSTASHSISPQLFVVCDLSDRTGIHSSFFLLVWLWLEFWLWLWLSSIVPMPTYPFPSPIRPWYSKFSGHVSIPLQQICVGKFNSDYLAIFNNTSSHQYHTQHTEHHFIRNQHPHAALARRARHIDIRSETWRWSTLRCGDRIQQSRITNCLDQWKPARMWLLAVC